MRHFRILFLLSVFSILFNSCDADVEPVDPQLLVPQPTACSAPSFFNVSALIAGNSVNIVWDETSGSAWEIQYGPDGFAIGSGTTVNFTAASSLVSGLDATVNYDFYIRTKCSDDQFSSWIGPVAPGSNIEVCVDPTGLTAVRNPTDATKANITWAANASADTWEVQYGVTGFTLGSGTIVSSSTPSKVITGLATAAAYNVYVRSNCSATQNSNWVGPIVINAAGVSTCNTPSAFTAVRNLNTQGVLHWTAGGSETSWEIQYGAAGFAVGSGTSVTSTTTSKTITGLAATSYDFYVRAKCSATSFSTWVGPMNIAAVGAVDNTPALMTANIAGVQFNNMKPFMYPITNDVQVTNDGAPVGDPRYLWIQGDTSNNLNTLIEINLYIPDNFWSPGTHSLTEVDNFETATFCQARMLANPGAIDDESINIVSGTIMVSEFNLSTKRIKGTFSFSYEKIVNGVSVGTFNVTNGTFNYGLDDPYFN